MTRFDYLTVRWAVLVVLMSMSCAGSPRPELDSCDWSAEGVIGLTEHGADDVISASVSGPSCEASVLMLAIRTSDRSVIYRFDAPLAVFFSTSGDASAFPETSAPERARGLVEEITKAQELRTVGSLPSWAAGELDDGMSYHQYLLPRSEVERLQDQPLFYHPAGWEYGFQLAFDPRAGQVVRVLESWRYQGDRLGSARHD